MEFRNDAGAVKPRVLVVEDSLTQAREMQFLLEAEGFAVAIARDGLEALGCIRAAAPDVIVTDFQMPGMDGLALTEAVRHDFPFVPVVLVTAFGSERAAAQALRAGAASYVPKRDLVIDLVPTLKDIFDITMRKVNRRNLHRNMTRMEAQFVLDNYPAQVSPLVLYLEEVLDSMQFCDPARLINVGVALREALVNAIDRGNLEIDCVRSRDDGDTWGQIAERRRRESPYIDRRVHLSVALSRSEATFVIRHEGPGFDYASRLAPADPSDQAGVIDRGLVLIQAFMDEVVLAEMGREITLVKRGAASSAGPTGSFSPVGMDRVRGAC